MFRLRRAESEPVPSVEATASHEDAEKSNDSIEYLGWEEKEEEMIGLKDSHLTIVRSGVMITGELSSSDDILIEGEVNGNIRANNVVVAQGATVVGTVDAAVITVNGRLHGEVSCTRLQVNTNGIVEGNITHSVLVVEAGANIEGTVNVRKSAEVVRTGEIVTSPIQGYVALENRR